MSAMLDKFLVILRRDALTALRYRTASWAYLAGMLAEMAAFFYLARAVGPSFRPDGIAYFPFLLIGTGFYGFFVAGVAAFVSSVHDAQLTGTMEVLMTTSTAEPVLVFLTAFSAFLSRILHLAFYLVVGLLLFRVPLGGPNIPGALLVVALSVPVAVAMGIAAAAVQVAIQKGNGVVWLLSSVLWLVTGVTFPISVLPEPLRRIGELIPITHSLDGLRLALLQNAGWASLARPLLVLGAYAAFLLPVSVWMLDRSLRHARRAGTLSYY